MDREHPDSGQPFTSGLTMTLRDYFAAAALTGMLSGNDANADDDVVAKCAYEMADAMLKAREVKP